MVEGLDPKKGERSFTMAAYIQFIWEYHNLNSQLNNDSRWKRIRNLVELFPEGDPKDRNPRTYIQHVTESLPIAIQPLGKQHWNQILKLHNQALELPSYISDKLRLAGITFSTLLVEVLPSDELKVFLEQESRIHEKTNLAILQAVGQGKVDAVRAETTGQTQLVIASYDEKKAKIDVKTVLLHLGLEFKTIMNKAKVFEYEQLAITPNEVRLEGVRLLG